MRTIIADLGLIIYSKGVRYRPSGAAFAGSIPPEREKGDIKGWSLSSRRRMRQWLMTHNGPSGWSSVAIDLTFPALPVGVPDPLVSRDEAISVFQAFVHRLTRAGWGLVWRLEVQPRKKTKRADLRGKPQPHYHCIGVCPPGVDPVSARDHWLAVLGPRGAVPGALDHAARVSICDDWTGARIRYLHDHASKAKLEQVAVGWGRHWGVIGRRQFVQEFGRAANLSRSEEFEAARILRRLIRRRVSDPRARGGVNWSTLELTPTTGKPGVHVAWMGGGRWFPASVGGIGSPGLARAICQAMGKAKSNVWALRLSRARSPVGWRFGVDGDKLCSAARLVNAWKEKQDEKK